MKKTLLKTAFICLGITLLCGLYSFKTPEGVKSQQNYRTASIVYDTIITPDGEELQCLKKEVVVEGDKNGCTCTLEVIYDGNNWALRVKKSNLTEKDVVVTYSYKIYGLNGSETPSGIKKAVIRSYATNIQEPLAYGKYKAPFDCNDFDLTVCEIDIDSFSACYYVAPNKNR